SISNILCERIKIGYIEWIRHLISFVGEKGLRARMSTDRPKIGAFFLSCGANFQMRPPRRGPRSAKTMIAVIVVIGALLIAAILLASGALGPFLDEGGTENDIGPMVLVAPADGMSVAIANVSWEPNPLAVGYLLLISSSPSMKDPVVETTLLGTSYIFTGADGAYHWNVHAFGPNGIESVSPTWSFSITSPLLAPSFIGTNGETLTMEPVGSVTIRWTSLPSVSYYKIQISEDSSFLTLVADVQEIGAHHTCYELHDDRSYYARVKAVGAQTESGWSATYKFDIRLLAAGVPTILEPAQDDTVVGTDVTFRWTAVAGASSYRLLIDDDADLSSPAVDATASGANYTLTGRLENGETYYWRVSAIDFLGEGDPSVVSRFYKGFESFQRHYDWLYEGNTFSIDLDISGRTYYEQKVLNSYIGTYYRFNYAGHVDQVDSDVKEAASAIEQLALAKGYGTEGTLNLAMAFVQSLNYGLDNDTTGYDEYVRHPVETLVDGVGDCDCKAVLLLSIIQTIELGYDGVLLMFEGAPGHMAVGVAGSFVGTFYADSGMQYFYCETTAIGWEVGEVPPEISSRWTTATIIYA
ncbi:MAG: hypothetical protein LLG16_08015, partial [Euryarchaeota archaeon]|nr:hypothetical protein [Euryarchaeota archaeon]